MSMSKKNKPTWNKYKKVLNLKWLKERYPFFCKIEQPIEKNECIYVKCKFCENWFKPTSSKLAERIRQLEKPRDFSEQHFYCSENCKSSCNLYYAKSNQKNTKTNLSGEIKIWREEVLKRANYECEYCGEDATIAHHSRPQKLEPFFSLDPYYGISCCEKCHYEKGHNDECSTGNLASIICK
jgi:hypothetical protein